MRRFVRERCKRLYNIPKVQAFIFLRTSFFPRAKCYHNDSPSLIHSTVNIAFSERAFSECSHLVNGFKRDRSAPSKEQRAKEASIGRTLAFSRRTLRLRSAFTQCHLDCITTRLLAQRDNAKDENASMEESHDFCASSYAKTLHDSCGNVLQCLRTHLAFVGTGSWRCLLLLFPTLTALLTHLSGFLEENAFNVL